MDEKEIAIVMGKGYPNSWICEYCGERKERTLAPCPDGRPGCAVAHFKLTCKSLCEYKEGN